MKTKIKILGIVFTPLILVIIINEKFYANNTSVEVIDWVNSYDEGLNKAQETNKNMFVLITAPTWCHYCKVFEKKVLKKEKIQTFLNENYVPVLVLDQINGNINPDLSRFDFPGFPTIYIYNKRGNMIKGISTLDSNEMLVFLKQYAQTANKDNVINGNMKLADNVPTAKRVQ
ncbi:MAG: thioredoxin family protein [Candidatus Anammoxibacter sp.]